MTLSMSTEYRGHVIRWSDWGRHFIISFDDHVVKKDILTLEDCEKWIDTKQKQKFKRIAVLSRETWGAKKVVEGVATSVIDDEHVWFVDKNNNRSKVRTVDLWIKNGENQYILGQIKAKELEISKLQSEIKALENSAERLNTSMLVIDL